LKTSLTATAALAAGRASAEDQSKPTHLGMIGMGGRGSNLLDTLLMFHEFLKAVRSKTPAPQKVCDAATWSAVVPLSNESVAHHGKLIAFPDFTRGKWKTNPPLAVYEA
jgi:hypothetical protein